MIRFLKIIQDSDFATGILLLIIASFSYGGVDEGIWDGYGYIDWVFPIMSSFLLFAISAVYISVGIIKLVKGNINDDLKIEISQIPSIINVRGIIIADANNKEQDVNEIKFVGGVSFVIIDPVA